jgi:hypothetical protein
MHQAVVRLAVLERTSIDRYSSDMLYGMPSDEKRMDSIPQQSDWLTIDEALALIIENNPDAKVPAYYECVLGGTTIQKLQVCVENSLRRLEKGLSAPEEARRRNTRRREHAEYVLALAERIEGDLHQEAYNARSGAGSVLDWDEADPPRVRKQSLIEWVWTTEKIDVDGYRARKAGDAPPLTPRYTDQISTADYQKAFRRVAPSGEQLWREYVEAEKRQRLFLANACLLTLYLDAAQKNWRKEIARQRLTEVEQLYDKGVVRLGDLTSVIRAETRLSKSTSEKLIKRLLERILEKTDLAQAYFTERETRSATQLLMGIAFAYGRARKAILPTTDRDPFASDPSLLLKHLIKNAKEEEQVALQQLEPAFEAARAQRR